MAAFVVGLSIVAAKSGAVLRRSVAASSATEAVGSGQQPPQTCARTKGATGFPTGTRPAQPSSIANARLTAALRSTLRASTAAKAQISVGVIDITTGTEASFHASEQYHAADVASADILAALSYEHQQHHTAVSGGAFDLAAKMMETGSRAAAAALWQAIGRGPGLAAANRALRLRHTSAGNADGWARTKTTVADQLQLLADLATDHSALRSDCRDYELSLMGSVAATRHWGVPAAARPGTKYAVSDGWQPDPRRFVVNSVGVIDYGGHELLVAVLSQDWTTKAAGMSAVRAAAIAAASAISKSA